MIDGRWTISIAGLLTLASACKDEAPSGSPSEVNAPADAADAKAATAEAGAKVEAPPPSGHAVAKVEALPTSGYAVVKEGSLLFFSSTGDEGFKVPPLAPIPGMVINVVGEQDGRLVAETLATKPVEHHCAVTLSRLADFRLRFYLSKDDLVPVLTEELEHSFADGTKVRLARGIPVPEGSAEILARGTAVRVPVPAERLGRFYQPGPPFSRDGGDGQLYAYAGRPLTYDGHTLDETFLYHEGREVKRFSTTERGTEALVTVRNPCLEVTGLVSAERLSPVRPPMSILELMEDQESGNHGFSLYASVFTEADEEDGWGGLVDTGRTQKTYEVKAGTAITWADGSPAGQVTADHRFTTAPRNEGGRSCFDAPLFWRRATTLTLCFAPGDVGKRSPSRRVVR